MNSTIEGLYQDIGREALSAATALGGRLLLYSEVELGVASADLFYVEEGSDLVRLRFAPSSLRRQVYALWEEWKTHTGNREWRAMSYVIDGGEFTIDLTYPDQLIPNEDLSDRRPRVVRKYFGDAGVNYSAP